MICKRGSINLGPPLLVENRSPPVAGVQDHIKRQKEDKRDEALPRQPGPGNSVQRHPCPEGLSLCPEQQAGSNKRSKP